MEARIHFRIDENTKKLAQLSAERKGITLSDAYRNLTEELAREQLEIEKHSNWLATQVDEAYEKYSSGRAEFVSNETANAMMQRKLNKLRNKPNV
jgi:antitoxin component of RelBE/YafQ-DinJ toxin-antitoxin module